MADARSPGGGRQLLIRCTNLLFYEVFCRKLHENKIIRNKIRHWFHLSLDEEQECIPVGCVAITAVVVTRCQYRGSLWPEREGSPSKGVLHPEVEVPLQKGSPYLPPVNKMTQASENIIFLCCCKKWNKWNQLQRYHGFDQTERPCRTLSLLHVIRTCNPNGPICSPRSQLEIITVFDRLQQIT